MKPNGSCPTVRPLWICGAQAGQEVEEIGEQEVEQQTESQEDELEVAREDDDNTDKGKREMKKMLDPLLPTEAEVQQHNLSHLPYRNWCPHCVRGRGVEMEHRRRRPGDEPPTPEYHLDYCFPGDTDGNKLTVLVAVEKQSRMKRGIVVPSKGSTGQYAARVVMEMIDECGHRNVPIIIKTDQEPAIKLLVDDLKVARTGAQTMTEEAPKGSKGSNGVVERAVRSVEEYLRTLKSALDARMLVCIDARHPVLTWLVDHASFLLNRLEVAADGKTAYERMKGKKAEVLGLEFGEKVMWKHPKGQKMEKLNARWSFGMFLGIRARSTEAIIVDEESKKVKFVRTVRRVPEQQRWSVSNLAQGHFGSMEPRGE